MSGEWKEGSGEWTKGSLKIRFGQGLKHASIYHVYNDGKYIAQCKTLDEAKAKAVQLAGKKG